MERICEMGQVMRRAVQVDDKRYCSVKEQLAQLEVMALSKSISLEFLLLYVHVTHHFVDAD